MKNNIPSEKIVPFIEDKLHIKFNSLIDKKGVVVRKQGEGMVLDKTDEMSVIVKLSDMTTDRSGEVLVPEGCDYSEYMNNPVVCLFHDYSILPLAKITEIQVTEKAIYGKMKFGTTEKCKEIYQLVKDGILSATSVGFVATEELIKGTRQFAQYIKDNAERLTDIENINKIITKWTLLEDSLVNIGCNPNALILAKSYASEDMINKLAKLNKINLKEAMDDELDYTVEHTDNCECKECMDKKGCSKKEEEVKPEDVANDNSTPEDSFSETEVTPANEVMPSQEVKPEDCKEIAESENVSENPIIHAENCECKECMAKKGCAKKENEEVCENMENNETKGIKETNTEITKDIISEGNSTTNNESNTEPKETKETKETTESKEVEKPYWTVISEPIDELVKKELEIIEKKKRGKIS